MGPGRGRERKISRHREPQLDLRTGQTSAGDLVGDSDPIGPQVLDLVPEFSQFRNEFWFGHGAYETGVGPVETEMNVMWSCMWISLFGSFW